MSCHIIVRTSSRLRDGGGPGHGPSHRCGTDTGQQPARSALRRGRDLDPRYHRSCGSVQYRRHRSGDARSAGDSTVGRERGLSPASRALRACRCLHRRHAGVRSRLYLVAEVTSQTCAACAVVDSRSSESQARFACIGYGATDHADVDAALEIERRWNPPLLDMEGVHRRPSEAMTGRDLEVCENPVLRGGKDVESRCIPMISPDDPASEKADATPCTMLDQRWGQGPTCGHGGCR